MSSFDTEVLWPRKHEGGLPKGGHAPGYKRDALLEWLEESQAELPPHWVVAELWNCTDVLPGWACDDLGLAQGSSYAMGVRRIMEPVSGTPLTSMDGECFQRRDIVDLCLASTALDAQSPSDLAVRLRDTADWLDSLERHGYDLAGQETEIGFQPIADSKVVLVRA